MSVDQNNRHATQLIERWQAGEPNALKELVSALYAELQSLANAQLRRDHNASIQCSELVAEAYIKLIGVDEINLQDRNHFMSLVARIMRRVLVERFRKNNSAKRNQTLLTYDDSTASSGKTEDQQTFAVDQLDNALKKLEKLDPRQAEIVSLRFFGGFKNQEIASILGISERTVKRDWVVAKLWLFNEIQKQDELC